MSRIGKNPVAIPSGVTVDLDGQTLKVKGRQGELVARRARRGRRPPSPTARITITPRSDEPKRARAMWGTTRALVNNMVTGVSDGFTRNLEINGVGYRAAVQGKA